MFRMRFTHFIFVLLGTCFLNCGFAKEPCQPVTHDLEAAVKQSQNGAPACKEFSAKMEKLLAPGNTVAMDVFRIPKTKALAEELWTVIKTYPGADPAAASIPEILKTAARTPGCEFDIRPVFSVMGCNSMILSDGYRALTGAAKEYRFSASKKREIANKFFEQGVRILQTEPSLLSGLLLNRLADQLIRERLITVSDPLFVLMTDLYVRYDALYDEVRTRNAKASVALKDKDPQKLNIDQQKPLREAMMFEILQSYRLAIELQRVFERIAQSSASN